MVVSSPRFRIRCPFFLVTHRPLIRRMTFKFYWGGRRGNDVCLQQYSLGAGTPRVRTHVKQYTGLPN